MHMKTVQALLSTVASSLFMGHQTHIDTQKERCYRKQANRKKAKKTIL
ncbi:MAG TPA: hypothetical protein VK133_02835 [Amoebophilaceae bacterium]|nr:hypothetical protein [Amoebophilaceae bacterium]